MSTDREMICGVEMPKPAIRILSGTSVYFDGYTADQFRKTVTAAVALKYKQMRSSLKNLNWCVDSAQVLAIDCLAVKDENLALLKTMLELRAEIERLKGAVAAEREACADLCYQMVDNSRETRFATAIRARGNK